MQTLSEIRQQLATENISLSEIVANAFGRYQEKTHLNAILEWIGDAFSLSEVPEGPLNGLVFGHKDNFLLEGFTATAGSAALRDYVAPYSATILTRMRAAGAIPVARLNCDAFAMGETGRNSAWGPVLHPQNPEWPSGGSSSGPAATVAAGILPVAIGSDTGGSVRVPAAFCGICGFKPTWGAVSRHGLVAFASSLDTPGLLGRDISDIFSVFRAVSGPDTADSATVAGHLAPGSKIAPSVIGIPSPTLIAQYASEKIQQAWFATIDRLKITGWSFREVKIPDPAIEHDVYKLISTAEAASNLARFDGLRYGRHPGANSVRAFRSAFLENEVKMRLLEGNAVLQNGKVLKKAMQVRAKHRSLWLRTLGQVDFVLTPTTPCFPEEYETFTRKSLDIFTAPANLAGLPALTVPIDVDNYSVPVGIQVLGKPYLDLQLFSPGSTLLKQQ